VFASRKEISAAEQIKVCLRVIAGNFFDNVLNTNHLILITGFCGA
jgi:hypothetical protein